MDGIDDILPSARAAKKKANMLAAQIEAENVFANMQRDFEVTFSREEGKRVLAWIKERSGFGNVILSADRASGKIDPYMTTFAAMELNFYLAIRKYLTPELLNEVENGRRTKPSGTSSTSGGNTRQRRRNVKR